MTLAEMRTILFDVNYLDYEFVVREGHGGIFLQAVYTEPDVVTGLPEPQYTRKWLLSPYMVKSELVQTALKCVLTSAEHRVREHFLYRGRRIFGPHFDVDALVQICDDKQLDYRIRKTAGNQSSASPPLRSV